MKNWSWCQSVPGSGYGSATTSATSNLRRLRPGTRFNCAHESLEAGPSSLISLCARYLGRRENALSDATLLVLGQSYAHVLPSHPALLLSPRLRVGDLTQVRAHFVVETRW